MLLQLTNDRRIDFQCEGSSDFVTCRIEYHPIASRDIKAHPHLLFGKRASNEIIAVVERDSARSIDLTLPASLPQVGIHPV
jgi:hypothetical protein